MTKVGARCDVFISYSKQDAVLARKLWSGIQSVGANAFLAELSIQPGSDWRDEILKELRSCKFVFFLASKAACQSHAVQQELGASLIQKKFVIPILIDISPSELPGFIGSQQAIDLRSDDDRLKKTIHAVGKKVRDDKFVAGLIFAAAAIVIISSK